MSFVNNIYIKIVIYWPKFCIYYDFCEKIPKNKSQNENTIPQIIQTCV